MRRDRKAEIRPAAEGNPVRPTRAGVNGRNCPAAIGKDARFLFKGQAIGVNDSSHRSQWNRLSSATASDMIMQRLTTGWKRWLLWGAGQVCVGLAIAGVFLPVLPTTPFLLLASACFVKSSPKSQQWLMEHRLTGPFLRDWQQHHAVRRSVKWTAFLIVLAIMSLTLWLSRSAWPIQVATLALCGIGLTVIVRLPVIRDTTLDANVVECPSSRRKSA